MTKLGREKHDAIMAVARQRQKRRLAALPPNMAEAFGACLDRLQREAETMLEELGPRRRDQLSWRVGRNRISFTSTSSGWLIAKATIRAKVSAGTAKVVRARTAD